MLDKKEIKKKIQRANEDLEDLQLYINDFSNFLPLAVFTINPLGRIVNINKAAERLTGYSPIEIMGDFVSTIFLEKEKVEKIEKEIAKVKSISNAELTLTNKEGKRIPVSVFVSVREDVQKDFIGYFLAFSDITEIKNLQQNLEKKVGERTQELRLSKEALVETLKDVEEARRDTEDEKNKTLAIITNFADGILVFDKINNLLLINSQAEKFFKVEAKDIISKSISKISSFNFLAKLLEKRTEKIFRKEFEIKENLVLEVSVLPIIRGAEETGSLVILHDVTREKLVEKMKSEFVSLAAHQLRTPLSTMKWIMRMILDEEMGTINKEQKEFLEDSYQANERMIYLISDLLNVARIEEGRFLYELTPLNIQEMIESIVSFFESDASRRKVKVEFKKPRKKMPEIMLDSEKIKIAIENLVDNAIRYSLPGGKVTIAIKQNEKQLEVFVKDSGVGIPKNQQSRIFTKFFRGNNVMRMDTEGNGLGLYITKNIIESHEGKIWFESKLKEGTTFYFKLPIKNKK